MNDKNIIELIQEITPLLYHLISRLKNEEENLLRKLIIELEFPSNEHHLEFKRNFKINDENPLNSIKEFIKGFEDEGYFITFSRHFNLIILLKSKNWELSEEDSEEESEEEREEAEEKSEEESEEPIINADKTFKSDVCVICLTNSPNVLFCNCGHIAICEECDEVKSLKTCPICKTENKIKQTVEY